MSEQKPSSFMDSKTLMAIAMVAIFWFLWDRHMADKYPDYYKERANQQQQAQNAEQATPGENAPTNDSVPTTGVSGTAANGAMTGTTKNDEIGEVLPKKEKLVSYDSEYISFDVSSKGMGLKNVVLKKYQGRDRKPKTFDTPAGYLPFETNVMGRRNSLDFVVERKGTNQFFGRANIQGMTIEKVITVDPEKYIFDSKVNVINLVPEFSGLQTYLTKQAIKSQPSPLPFLPSYDRQELFFDFDGDDTSRVLFMEDAEESTSESFAKTKLAAVGSQYFALAYLDKSGVIPNAKGIYDHKSKTAMGILTHEVLGKKTEFNISYLGFVGPKSLKLLDSIDDKMGAIIDFGWFSSIAVYILKLMKTFYGVVGNWGIAIILLTILVRLIVLPINIMSYKSMKKMQAVQPMIKQLREKYKDDKTKLNQETMALMRENQVNPLGGCLPMFIQIPVFIALYQVLAQSIELYQAPFGLWIHDLSLRDPYFVLPVLMAATMFMQQKITPNTMEPAQQKVMMVLPLVFGGMMSTFPSGLTLYIFISTLFGVVQQYVFMKPEAKPA